MAQGIPKEVMMNGALVKELAEVAKDAALLHGVQMRIQETPNSSEVRRLCTDGQTGSSLWQSLKSVNEKNTFFRDFCKSPATFSAPGCCRVAVCRSAALVKQACEVILGIWPRGRWRDSGQIFIKLLCNYRDLLAKCLFSFLTFLFGLNGSVMSACFVSLNDNNKVSNATRMQFTEDKKISSRRDHFFSVFSAFQLVTYAPFTLFPSPVPKAVFRQALEVQTHYNTLVDRISQDSDFLREALER